MKCHQPFALAALLAAAAVAPRRVLGARAPPALPPPSRLRVEHRRTGEVPCLDEPAPRLSWDVPAPGTGRRGVVQVSYRVVVSLAAEPAAATTASGGTDGVDAGATENGPGAVLWDSGVVASNRSVLVEYAGARLPSHARVEWTVQLNVTADGWAEPVETPPSVPAAFRTAFMPGDANPLASSWVTPPEPCDAAGACMNSLRTEFNLALPAGKRVTSARVYYAAPGYASVSVNGASVRGADRLGPWTTWSERVLYQCYDATGLTKAESGNAVGVTLGNGQYRGPWSRAWTPKPPPLAFALTMRVSFSDGTSTTVASTSSPGWKASTGPLVWSDVYAGERYNASAFAKGWDAAGFDDAGWKPVAPLNVSSVPLSSTLSAHAYAPMREIETVTAINVTHVTATGAYLFWFPQNAAGVTTLSGVKGPRGATISLSHGEILKDPDGNLCLVGCNGKGDRVYYPWAASSLPSSSSSSSSSLPGGGSPKGGAVDEYTFAGDPDGESYTFQFTYHGYQFLQIDGWTWSPGPTLDQVRRVIVHSDNAPLGPNPTFGGEGGRPVPLLTQIHDNIRRSLLSNMHSVESDCPTRERVGWTGDAQATAETAFLSLDVGSFHAKWMQDMQDAQLASGALSSTVPYAKHFPPVDPSWPTAYPQIVRLLHRYTGDTRVVARHLGPLKRYVDYIATVTSCPNCPAGDTRTDTRAPNGLPWFYMNGDWMEFVPQSVELADSGKILSSFHYLKDVRIVSELSAVVGDDNASRVYGALADTLVAKFNEVYLSQNHSVPPSGGAGMCGEEREIRKGGAVVRLGCGQGRTIAAVEAFFGTPIGNCTSGFRANASCDAKGALAIVKAACVEQESCTLQPSTAVFGDPCKGTVKSLAARVVSCAGGPPPPPPSPPAPTPRAWSYGEQQVCNAAPLAEGGIVPAGVADSVRGSLLAQIAATGGHATTGFIGNKYLLQALVEANRTDVVVDLLLQTSLPSLGYQVAQGATTLWENWSGGAVDSNATGTPSHNHHFMGAFGAFLWTSLVGMRQGSGTAWEHFEVAPAVTHDPRLTSAAGTSLTPRGNASVSWARRGDGSVDVNVTVPPNAQARIVAPSCASARCALVESGAGVAAGERGVLAVRRAGKAGPFEAVVGSGSYTFRVVDA